MIADTIDSLMQRLTVLKQATLQKTTQPFLIQGELTQVQCELIDLESQIKAYLDTQKYKPHHGVFMRSHHIFSIWWIFVNF